MTTAAGEGGPRSKLAARAGWLTLLVLCMCALLGACDRHGIGLWSRGQSGNLLAGLAPRRTAGVRDAERLTDGSAATEGDFWNSNLTSIFSSARAFVEYDLGKTTPIDAAYLQGDNNDQYVVSVSDDGSSFRTIWIAPPDLSGGGLRTRFREGIGASGRYVRVSAQAGDGAYAVSEVQLFAQRPAVFPPSVGQKQGVHMGESLRSKVIVFGFTLALLAVLAFDGAPWWWTLLLFAIPAVAGWDAVRVLADTWPVDAREVSVVRATAAIVAMAAVAREVFAFRRWFADRRAIVVVLAVSAFMAVAGFFNLGRPQFFNHRTEQPTYIHPFDMRVYYPVAKYFHELGFDGVYMASVAAYAEDSQRPMPSLSNIEIRDLKTHRMVRVGDIVPKIDEVRRRFTPERWQAFKRDMAYFRDLMGDGDFLGSMHDHGANATPVWMLFAHLAFAATTANDVSLGFGALLDPFLLLAAFIAIGRTFGIRTMLVAMVLFGANDFYMFGTNWGGATLRHDWMAYLGFGACALRKERWALGGAFLALSSLIRAFPATALAGTAIPALWWVGDYRRRHRRWPSFTKFRKTQRAFEQVVVGAAVCTVGMVLLTVLTFGPHAWFDWLAKVILLSRDPHVNHISLRTLVAGSDALQAQTLSDRMPLFIGLLVAYTAAVVVIARRQRIDQAASLSLVGIALFFYPANYYIHFIFLLPLVANEIGWRAQRRAIDAGQNADARPIDAADAVAWLGLLGICFAQYYTVLEHDLELHFYYATVILFGGLTAMFVGLLVRETARTPEPAPAPAVVAAEQLSLPLEPMPESTPDAASEPEHEPRPAAPKPSEANEPETPAAEPSATEPEPVAAADADEGPPEKSS